MYLANWLTNKSNDTKGKMHYGENAVRASKNAKYMCKICGQSDVRTLEIDHKDGHRANKGLKNLICLCGNCHNIKTRQSGLEKRLKEKVIKLGADSRKKNVPNYIENEYVAIKNLLKSLYS
ncbi:MAG: HNH endonuclease [Bacteroidetes bacterium]|nr:HNH endonuclease [Bacteroidota bacterium]